MSEVRDQDYGTYHDEAVNVPVLERPKWWDKAACLGAGTKRWFMDGAGPTAEVQEAKAICAACPVRDDCREWAIDNLAGMGDIGVWGGTTRHDRRRIRRERGMVDGKKRVAAA